MKDEVDHDVKNEDGEVIDFSAVPTSWMINSILGDETKKREREKRAVNFFLFIYIYQTQPEH